MNAPDSIKHIIDDNLSGSVTLLKRLMVALENELLNPDLDAASFVAYIQNIRHKLETFTVIRHFCDELLLMHNISVQNFPLNYIDFIKEYKDFWEKTPQRLLSNLQKTVKLENRTVMLHSNSGTIREVFRLLAENDTSIKVYQTLSAPGEEGRIQAHDLANMGFRVSLISDAMSAEMLKKTHLLILGADQLRQNTFINKCGSYQMVLAAQEREIPVIVLTESRKVASKYTDDEFVDRSRDESEILLDEIVHPNLSAENLYFEEIPLYLVSNLITEKEIMRKG